MNFLVGYQVAQHDSRPVVEQGRFLRDNVWPKTLRRQHRRVKALFRKQAFSG